MPYKKGQTGNAGGKSKETVSIERKNANKAMKLREIALDAILKDIDGKENSEIITTLLSSGALKMLKDSEDRGLGAPIQAVFTEELKPEPTIDVSKLSMSALKEIRAAGLK